MTGQSASAKTVTAKAATTRPVINRFLFLFLHLWTDGFDFIALMQIIHA